MERGRFTGVDVWGQIFTMLLDLGVWGILLRILEIIDKAVVDD